MRSYKDKWWYSTLVIMLLSFCAQLIIPAILAVILMFIQMNRRKKIYDGLKEEELLLKSYKEKEKEIQGFAEEILKQEQTIRENQGLLDDQDAFIAELRSEFEKETAKLREEVLEKAAMDAEKIVQEANERITSVVHKVTEYQREIESLSEEHSQLVKEVNRYKTQTRKYKAEVIGLKNFNDRFPHTINFKSVEGTVEALNKELAEETLLGTVLRLHLHSENSKELRKLTNATGKEIKNVYNKYEERYTTKGNKTIYQLMVIGLQAEIQILLLQLKYNKLDESIQAVKDIITKYLAICANGNQSILPTITKFLSEIEPLYVELINIEYKYYVYREREKEEQRMIKEQMKQEAAERKQLAEEQKKLEKEEQKFVVEMERNKKLLAEEKDEEKIQQLTDRLKELEQQVLEIDAKKEEIASLTLGKAGYVYIISNLGSFGDNMFKIGMTRRMNPQDRVDELGSASVPFKFDVHAMVFSDDAVGLETKLHKELSRQRVNKVNFRKEFFNIDITSLREMVEELDPTVEFVTTMLAEEYNQTRAIEETQMVS